jgi:hypothetical protein
MPFVGVGVGVGFGWQRSGGAPDVVLPSAIASCVHWWSAEAGIIEVAGAVSSWADVIGSLAAVQATGASQPVYSATGFDGTEPGVTADGVDDYLAAVGTGSLPDGDEDSVIMVRLVDTASEADADTARGILGWGGASSATSRDVRRSAVSGVSRARTVVGTTGIVTETATSLLGKHYITGRKAGTTVAVSVNGGVEATAVIAASSTGTSLAHIFALPSGATTTGFKGSISDIAVFAASSLNGDDLANMQAFFGR